jgi:hypothetical protein
MRKESRRLRLIEKLALHTCAVRAWGLLSPNDLVAMSVREKRLDPMEAAEITEMGLEIDEMRARLGYEPYHGRRRSWRTANCRAATTPAKQLELDFARRIGSLQS